MAKWDGTDPQNDVEPAPHQELHRRPEGADVSLRRWTRRSRPPARSSTRRPARSATSLGGARTGTVIPLAEIGTDRHRLDMWTADVGEGLQRLRRGHAWKFSRFTHAPTGYVAAPLDGVWLQRPVPAQRVGAHAGRSARTGRKRARRTSGAATTSTIRCGRLRVAAAPRRERAGTPLDTPQPGNSNAGHTYGTTLSADDKRALLEYLKTFAISLGLGVGAGTQPTSVASPASCKKTPRTVESPPVRCDRPSRAARELRVLRGLVTRKTMLFVGDRRARRAGEMDDLEATEPTSPHHWRNRRP